MKCFPDKNQKISRPLDVGQRHLIYVSRVGLNYYLISEFSNSYITTYTFCLEILSCHFTFTRHRRMEKYSCQNNKKNISTKLFHNENLNLLHLKLWLIPMLKIFGGEISIVMRQLFKDASAT